LPISRDFNDDEFLHLQNSSNNVGLEEMLHQPSEKRSSVSKTVFVKGRQDSLEDVVALLANIMVLGRFWVKFMGTDVSTYPYVLRQLVGLADVLTSAKFRAFAATMKGVCPYLAHTLIVNIFNVFNGFVELAKNPHVIRELKATGKIDTAHVKIPLLIVQQLLEQLQLCIATGSTGILFARPPNTFAIFCPVLALSNNSFWSPLSPAPRAGNRENGGRNNNGGRHDTSGRWGNDGSSEGKRKGWESHPGYGAGWDRGGGTGGSGGSGANKRLNTNTNPPANQRNTATRGGGRSNGKASPALAGSIVNATGKKLFFPPGLSQKYCANFLDTAESCSFGDKCNFKHCKFPKDFPSDDIAAMMTLVSKTRGLSWNPVLRLPGGIRE